MLLLSLDTSGPQGSVALAQGDAKSFKCLGLAPLTGGMYSAELVPAIASLLQEHGFSKRQIDAFIVASGPGSFTGLRIGLATVKGLAEVLGKPIAAVSILEALAIAAGREGQVSTLLDAGRGEAYLGEFEVRGGRATPVREALLKREELAAALEPAGQATTPDADLAAWLTDRGLQVAQSPRPQADTLARIGLGKIVAGETVSAEELDANYIRRSDAEIFSLPKLNPPR